MAPDDTSCHTHASEEGHGLVSQPKTGMIAASPNTQGLTQGYWPNTYASLFGPIPLCSNTCEPNPIHVLTAPFMVNLNLQTNRG